MFNIESAIKYIGANPFDFVLTEDMFVSNKIMGPYGAPHIYRVMILCAEIARKLECPREGLLSFIAAFYHEAVRKDKDVFEKAGKLHRKYGLTDIEKNIIRSGLGQIHDKGWTKKGDIDYYPVSILKDADSLEQVRFKGEPNLRLNVSKSLIDDAKTLYSIFDSKNIVSIFTGGEKNNTAEIDFSLLDPYKDQTLRDYQTDCKKAIYDAWQEHNSVLLQMPTGTGKTRLFVSIVKDLLEYSSERKNDVHILLLAHRKELIEQISDHLESGYEIPHGYIASFENEDKRYHIQVGSVPTLIRRLDRWDERIFDVIIIDEAHHTKADSYNKILKTYPEAKVLGVTATPCRLNGEGFKPEFDFFVSAPSESWFIMKHYLCDYDYYSIRFDSSMQRNIDSIPIDFDGEYDNNLLLQKMDTDRVHAEIVASYRKIAAGKKGIVYTINKQHNLHVCSKFIAAGYNAVAIDADTPKDEREEAIKDFRLGKVEILCNVNIFSEGFDCPDTEFIQLARPTRSLSLYLQQVGRGLRAAEGKRKVIIIDNVGLYNRFGFPSSHREWSLFFDGFNTAEDFNAYLERTKTNKDLYIERKVYEIEEGNEDVTLLHNSELETMKETKLQDYSVSFTEYCLGKGLAHATQQSGILKNHIDRFIKQYIDDTHSSVLETIDINRLNDFHDLLRDCPEYIKENLEKHSTYATALNHYIAFAQEKNGLVAKSAIITPPVSNNMEDSSSSQNEDLANIELTIKTLKSLNAPIPEEVNQRHSELLLAKELSETRTLIESDLLKILQKYPKKGISFQYNEKDGLTVKVQPSVSCEKASNRLSEKIFGAKPQNKQDSSKKKLVVRFPDGSTLSLESSAETFLKAITKIGVERVRALNIVRYKIDLIGKTKSETYIQHKLSGYYVLTHFSNEEKVRIINEIGNKLNIKVIATYE